MTMYFSHTGQTVTLGDVSIKVTDFKSFEPDYSGLPKGVKERRYSMEGEGHVLIKTDGSEEVLESFWSEGNKYLANRYIYQAQLNARIGKTVSAGTARVSNTLAIIEVLNIKDETARLEAFERLDTKPTVEELWSALRQTRNNLLTNCDYTQLPDAPFSEEKKQEWAEYRQALRDITLAGEGDPLKITWPVEPTS